MGKSGYLPNIAINFGFFKNLAINSMEKRDYNASASALYSLNGCLGEDYLVTISTKEYNEKMLAYEVYQCNSCKMDSEKIVNKGQEDEKTKIIQIPSETRISEVKEFEIHNSFMDSVLLGSERKKVWMCKFCNKTQEIDKTNKIVPERANPFCIKIVWDCPIRDVGITNKFGYHEKFSAWFWNFLEEINWQEVLYRKEYKNQNDGEDMDSYKDKGDES